MDERQTQMIAERVATEAVHRGILQFNERLSAAIARQRRRDFWLLMTGAAAGGVAAGCLQMLFGVVSLTARISW